MACVLQHSVVSTLIQVTDDALQSLAFRLHPPSSIIVILKFIRAHLKFTVYGRKQAYTHTCAMQSTNMLSPHTFSLCTHCSNSAIPRHVLAFANGVCLHIINSHSSCTVYCFFRTATTASLVNITTCTMG